MKGSKRPIRDQRQLNMVTAPPRPASARRFLGVGLRPLILSTLLVHAAFATAFALVWMTREQWLSRQSAVGLGVLLGLCFAVALYIVSIEEPLPTKPDHRRAVIVGHITRFVGCVLLVPGFFGGLVWGMETKNHIAMWMVLAAGPIACVVGYRVLDWVETQIGRPDYHRHFPAREGD